jgi:hypothetical protein
MADSATYLYCIVHATKPPSAAGVPDGLPGATRPVVGPLTRSFRVVTATVPLNVYGSAVLESSLRNVRWVTDIALAHESVVEHFTRQSGSTVIPMKLFTMFSSEELAFAEMRPRVSQFQAIVRRIAGCEEWGVRITPRATADTESSSESRRAASGTAFLAAKKVARDVARQSATAAAEAAEQAYRTLVAIARDVRRRDDAPEGATAPPLLDAAFLVPAKRRQRFQAAVKQVADSSDRIVVTLSGPWPSYNFIDSGSSA